jgi:membrane associated rhomboid family serine protease
MSIVTRRNITFIFVLICSILAVFLLEFVSPEEVLTHGLVPRTQRGLVGIATMPFLHANLAHLSGNLVSLVILLAFMLAFHSQKLIVDVILIDIVGGLLLWLFGRSAVHVGASGLIYGLAGFMIAAGISQRRFMEVVGALAVAVLYGNSLFWGLLPLHPGVSWDGHLAGAVGGAIVGLTISTTPSPNSTSINRLKSDDTPEIDRGTNQAIDFLKEYFGLKK